jgi:hypothetical protein
MNPFFYSEEAGAKGLLPLSPAPPIPAEPASASLRTISLDDSEHLLHNHHASVASLRLRFTFAPERRSASFRNRCSPSPEYPIEAFNALNHPHFDLPDAGVGTNTFGQISALANPQRQVQMALKLYF